MWYKGKLLNSDCKYDFKIKGNEDRNGPADWKPSYPDKCETLCIVGLTPVQAVLQSMERRRLSSDVFSVTVCACDVEHTAHSSHDRGPASVPVVSDSVCSLPLVPWGLFPPQGHKYLRVVIADRRNFSLFWSPSDSHAWEPSLGFTLSTFFSFARLFPKPSHRAFTGGGGNYSPFCFTITLLIHVGWRVTKTSWGE